MRFYKDYREKGIMKIEFQCGCTSRYYYNNLDLTLIVYNWCDRIIWHKKKENQFSDDSVQEGPMNYYGISLRNIIIQIQSAVLVFVIILEYCMMQENKNLHPWILQGLQEQKIETIEERYLESMQGSQTKKKMSESESSNQAKNYHQKIVCLDRFFECTEEAKFIVLIAKFILIFNIHYDKIKSLQILGEKELSYISDFPLENILADTNRKQFIKNFAKTMQPPITMQPTTCSLAGFLTIIIQKMNNKINIKFLTPDNYIHCIACNVSPDEIIAPLQKLIDTKYKKIKTVLCFQFSQDYQVKGYLYNFFARKFKHVVYTCQYPQSLIQINYSHAIATLKQNEYAHIIYSDSKIILSDCQLSKTQEQNFQYLYNKYQKINKLITKPLLQIDSKITETMFHENQFCVTIYGSLYNVIINQELQNHNISKIHEIVIRMFLQGKSKCEQNKNKSGKKLAKKIQGHYPINILKGSKVCCVCQLYKKKKSRYKCEKCSESYSRDIALCIDHFKQYHENVHKYIPKGVRRGAYHNQLQQFNEKLEQSEKMEEQENISNTNIQSANKLIEGLQQQIVSGYKILQSFHSQVRMREGQVFPMKKQENTVKQEMLYYPPPFIPSFCPENFLQFYQP